MNTMHYVRHPSNPFMIRVSLIVPTLLNAPYTSLKFDKYLVKNRLWGFAFETGVLRFGFGQLQDDFP